MSLVEMSVARGGQWLFMAEGLADDWEAFLELRPMFGSYLFLGAEIADALHCCDHPPKLALSLRLKQLICP